MKVLEKQAMTEYGLGCVLFALHLIQKPNILKIRVFHIHNLDIQLFFKNQIWKYSSGSSETRKSSVIKEHYFISSQFPTQPVSLSTKAQCSFSFFCHAYTMGVLCSSRGIFLCAHESEWKIKSAYKWTLYFLCFKKTKKYIYFCSSVKNANLTLRKPSAPLPLFYYLSSYFKKKKSFINLT